MALGPHWSVVASGASPVCVQRHPRLGASPSWADLGQAKVCGPRAPGENQAERMRQDAEGFVFLLSIFLPEGWVGTMSS